MVLGRCAAAAAVLGGLAWVLKAGVILVTGDEPAVAFAVGLVLFPFALLGLWWLLGQADGKAGRVGGVVAAIAAGCGLLVVLVRAVGGEGVEPSEDDVTLLTPFITGAGVPCRTWQTRPTSATSRSSPTSTTASRRSPIASSR